MDYCGIPYFNVPPMDIDCIPKPNKISRDNTDLIPATSSVACENSLINLATPCNFPTIKLPSSDIYVTYHNMKKTKLDVRKK